MWQRIQTVYLIIAIIACAVCLCLPIANIVPEDLAANSTVYNLFTVAPDGTREYSWLSMENFLLIMSCTFAAIAIFAYKNRKLQAVECVLGIVFTLVWNVIYCIWAFSGMIEFSGEFKPSFAACLPAIAMILFFLARKAILKDEALVRSMDRIR